MLAAAIEAEVAAFVDQHSPLKTEAGKAAIVRNGYLPERSIQTGPPQITMNMGMI